MKQAKVAIVVLNYNGKENVLECLKTVFRISGYQDIRISVIVVDNGSTDSSVKEIQNLKCKIQNINAKFKIHLIENKENLGFAEGNNTGIRYALENNTDYALLLNNDTLVKQDFLLQLIKTAVKNKKIGIACPKIYFAPGFEFHKKRYEKKDLGKVIWFAGGKIDWQNVLTKHIGVDKVDKGQFNKEEKIEFATGCCMLIRREVFEKIGLFDKNYFLYWEDVDFSQRVARVGFDIIFAPKAIIWHKNAGSSASGSLLHDYYLTRNRLYFGLKYARLRAKIALFKEGFFLLLNGRKGQKKGAFDFFLRRFGEIKDD